MTGADSTPTDSEASEGHPLDRLDGPARLLLVGVAAGWLGGTGVFLNVRSTFTPVADPTGVAIFFVMFAGFSAYVFAPSVEGSLYTGLVAFVVGAAVLFAGLLVPLWILPYDPAVRDVLMTPLIARGTVIVFTWFGYFLGLGFVAGVVLNRLFDLR